MDAASVAGSTERAQPVLAVRRGAGDAVRSVGDGLQQAGSFVSVELDKASIVPVEALFDVSRSLSGAAERGGLVGRLARVGSQATNAVGFVGAFYSMVLSGMLTTPGRVASDLTGRVADRIDGGAVAASELSQAIEDAAAGNSATFP